MVGIVDSEKLSSAFTACLNEHGLNGKFIAKKAGLSEYQVSHVKTKGRTNTDTLFAISNALLETNPEAAKTLWRKLLGEI